MKKLLFLFLLICSSALASNPSALHLIKVMDKNNESVVGAKVVLLGTDKVYYTNSKGECYIPVEIFKTCQAVKIESISYKSITCNAHDLNSKIILEFR